MKIAELRIQNTAANGFDVSWRLSEGDQSSYDLFLIEGGAIIERVRRSGDRMRATLHTIAEPMKEYALLLTVRSGSRLDAVRTGFCTQRDATVNQRTSYLWQ